VLGRVSEIVGVADRMIHALFMGVLVQCLSDDVMLMSAPGGLTGQVRGQFAQGPILERPARPWKPSVFTVGRLARAIVTERSPSEVRRRDLRIQGRSWAVTSRWRPR
jgi:hypothetical protein